ncbi:MAG: Spx/MgsR family RNA polymerase-binding regulatory protein [Pseudomonadota bacterium]
MTLDIYGLKNCDTCRKALKALAAKDVETVFHDLREDGVTKAQIKKWAAAAGWETLLNKRSTTWRGLPDALKNGVTETRAVALMADHPTLLKRPIIERGPTQVFVGWSKETEATLTR